MNAFAIFDALAIANNLRSSLGNVAVAEIHLFSYLGCVLSIYAGKPYTDWQYSFAGTKEGSPFSADLHEAIMICIETGFLEDRDGFLSVTDYGKEEYTSLSSFTVNKDRGEMIEAACASVLTLPVGFVREAISSDPELTAATKFDRARPLLTEVRRDTLYDIFAALAKLIGRVDDLIVPVVVWLRYLSDSRKSSPITSAHNYAH